MKHIRMLFCTAALLVAASLAQAHSLWINSFAKSFMTVGEWKDPKPLGQGLEFIPRTDLSDLHAGDLVEVDVLFYGEPLNVTALP